MIHMKNKNDIGSVARAIKSRTDAHNFEDGELITLTEKWHTENSDGSSVTVYVFYNERGMKQQLLGGEFVFVDEGINENKE